MIVPVEGAAEQALDEFSRVGRHVASKLRTRWSSASPKRTLEIAKGGYKASDDHQARMGPPVGTALEVIKRYFRNGGPPDLQPR